MALWGVLAPAALPAQTDLRLDDFHDPARPEAASRWEGFTDRVRTENNGGFLQMRLELVPGGKALDARLEVKEIGLYR
jgi:hypothetical protein